MKNQDFQDFHGFPGLAVDKSAFDKEVNEVDNYSHETIAH